MRTICCFYSPKIISSKKKQKLKNPKCNRCSIEDLQVAENYFQAQNKMFVVFGKFFFIFSFYKKFIKKEKKKIEMEEKKQVRVWVDGCFDMMHFGHANLLRQAKQLGDYLVVGVHSDQDILKNKGPTVMNEKER